MTGYPCWQAIPTKLSEAQFEEFLLPHLSRGRRGPPPTLPLQRIFNYILRALYMGCHLVQLAAAAAVHSEGAVHSHARRALSSGASGEEVRHALLSLTSTIGFPNVTAALSWAEDVLDQTDTLKD